MKVGFTVLLALCAVVSLTMASSSCDVTVLQTLAANKETFSDLIKVASGVPAVVKALSTDPGCGITLFAPTDDAFKNFPGPVPFGDALADLLFYHVTGGALGPSDLTDGALLDSLLTEKGLGGKAQKIKVTFDKAGNILLNGQKIVAVDVKPTPTGGFVHALAGVLVPPPSVLLDAASTPFLSTLAKAASLLPSIASALNTTAELTVFAPTNDAFKALPDGILNYLIQPENNETLAEVLTYHVVAGAVVYAGDVKDGNVKTLEGSSVSLKVDEGSVFVNDAKVVEANVLASNGVVHVIDNVLIPPNLNISTEGLFTEGLDLSALTGALKATGLAAAVFDSPDPLTIFAPTNAAFADISNALKHATTAEIKAILLNHVVGGDILGKPGVYKTLGGADVKVSLEGGRIHVELVHKGPNAKVVGVSASILMGKPFNGVYTLDKVLGVPTNQ